MLKNLVVDSSTLIALERANLIKFLNKIDYCVMIPKAVEEELKNEEALRFLKIEELKGKSLSNSRSLEQLNIGRGEAQCCSLAKKLKLKFIICDDRKFIRQKFLSNNKDVQNIKVLGFSFFLHIFYKKGLIDNLWEYFNKIIELSNWQRSEILMANYTFLKEMGCQKHALY